MVVCGGPPSGLTTVDVVPGLETEALVCEFGRSFRSTTGAGRADVLEFARGVLAGLDSLRAKLRGCAGVETAGAGAS
jgi:hypothetical protein